MAVTYTVLTAAKTTSGSLANWVNRSDLATENIVLEAEAWIYERLRVREMIADEAVTFSSAASSKALSTLAATFLDPIQFVPYTWGSPLEYVSETMFRPSRNTSGTLDSAAEPSVWTIIGATAHLDVLLSANFSGRMMYYARPAALSSTETNFLTVRYPTLLRYALMGKAYDHMKDTQRSLEYLQKAEVAIAEAARTNEMYRRGQYA